jgi:hypothetical protein
MVKSANANTQNKGKYGGRSDLNGKHVMGVLIKEGLPKHVERHATDRKVCYYIEADVSNGESLIRDFDHLAIGVCEIELPASR